MAMQSNSQYLSLFQHYTSGPNYFDPNQDAYTLSGFEVRALGPVSSTVGNRRDPNPFSYSKSHERSMFGFIDFRGTGPGDWGTFDGCLGNMITPPIGPNFSLDISNEAVSKFINAIRQADFNLPVALGELKETARLGSELLEQTKRFVRHFPPGKLITMGSAVLAKAWLTYSYGIRPVMNDIYGILQIQPRTTYDMYIKVRVARTEENRSRDIDNQLFERNIFCRETQNIKFNAKVSVPNPLTDFGNRVNFFNPALLVWELIPLSFVADWFVNVGSTLDILGAALSMADYSVSGSKTTFRKSLVTYEVQGSRPSPPYTITSSYKGSFDRVECERVLINSIPFPSLPRFKIPTGASQLLSAASLLRVLNFH